MNKGIFTTFLTITVLLASFSMAKAEDNSDSYEDEFASYEAEFSSNAQTKIYDPLEKINRKIFTFNDTIDQYIFEPLARSYRNYIPKPIRKSIHNFVTNLTLPISAINSFAQGKVENGLATSSNFLINSTIGIGGLFDVAENKNIKYEKEDFGQTLGHYGVNSGPYLMIPILGPSTGRDFGGYVFDRSIDPIGFNLLKVGGSVNAIDAEYRAANTTLYNLDLREDLLDPIADAKKDSFDLYATLRSVYIQQRDLKIKK